MQKYQALNVPMTSSHTLGFLSFDDVFSKIIVVAYGILEKEALKAILKASSPWYTCVDARPQDQRPYNPPNSMSNLPEQSNNL